MSPPDEAAFQALRHQMGTWFSRNQRALPWRTDRQPWHVWLSEVILQQTRVEQGLPYFTAFVGRFPSVKDLAEADLDEVLRLWEGLGYYSRCRNLHRAARQVMDRFDGSLPRTYEDWLSLPGVGPYTAAAVSSMAFSLPHPVLDGNVIRVLTRLAGIEEPVHTAAARRALQQLAMEFLDPEDPGRHNEALMELGALVCTPRRPECASCPLQIGCEAAASGRQEDFPVKKKARPIPHHDIAVGIIQDAFTSSSGTLEPCSEACGNFPGGRSNPGSRPRMRAAAKYSKRPE